MNGREHEVSSSKKSMNEKNEQNTAKELWIVSQMLFKHTEFCDAIDWEEKKSLECTWHAAIAEQKKLYKQAEAKWIGTKSILVKPDWKKNTQTRRSEKNGWKCRRFILSGGEI